VPAAPPGATTAAVPGWTTAPDGLLQQKSDIAAALSAMLGDPSADKSNTLDLHVVLAARNPGALELNLPDPAAWRIRYVANVALPSDTLTFVAEGALSIPLKLPDYAARLERVSFTAIGNLPPERRDSTGRPGRCHCPRRRRPACRTAAGPYALRVRGYSAGGWIR